MQSGFINKHTKHLPEKIAKFINNRSILFDCIAATRYCNDPSTACYKLGNWKECMAETSDAELSPLIAPYVNKVFNKRTYSGYTNEFKSFLEKKGFDKLYFCGVNTDCCVLATVFSCYDNVWDCAVIADLCGSTLGKKAHEHAIELLRDNITPDRIIHSSEI